MRLSEIAALLRPLQVRGLEPGEDATEVTDLAFDSRRASPGSLFFCRPGAIGTSPERAGTGRGVPPGGRGVPPRMGRTGPGPIPRRCRAFCMTILNVGAAVDPPQMGVGSSSTTPTAT